MLWGRALFVAAMVLSWGTACAAGVEQPEPPRTIEVTPESSPPNLSSRPLNDLEVKIAEALSEMGIDSNPAELSLYSAQMTALFDDGSELFVTAVPSGHDQGEFAVHDVRRIGTLTVETVQYQGISETRHRFTCGEASYEVFGAVPPNFETTDSFLSALGQALRCS